MAKPGFQLNKSGSVLPLGLTDTTDQNQNPSHDPTIGTCSPVATTGHSDHGKSYHLPFTLPFDEIGMS